MVAELPGRSLMSVEILLSLQLPVLDANSVEEVSSGGVAKAERSGEREREREDIELANGSFGLYERFEVLLCY